MLRAMRTRLFGYFLLGIFALGIPTAAQVRPQMRAARWHIFDCGTTAPMDPSLYDLKLEEIEGSRGFITP
jgi:hypothetical protein